MKNEVKGRDMLLGILFYALMVAGAFLLLLAVQDTARAYSAPSMTRTVANLTGREDARVSCVRLGGGVAGEAVKATGRIVLALDVCRALRAAPRITAPPYPNVNAGFAVFVLAHEAGHLVRGTGEMAESQADCYAAAHWPQYALAVGFTRSQLPALRRQVGMSGCWH